MKALTIGLSAIVALAALSFIPAHAEDGPLLVPGMSVAQDIPNAYELPDPNTNYKVLFSVNRDPENPDDVNPMFNAIATYLNTLGKYGVPPEHRNLIAMIHHRTEGFDIVMTNEAYRKRHGRDNPNIEIIRKLKEAGVDIRLCGQGLIGREIDAKDVNPDIRIDLWAMTSIINLELDGYVHIG
ncbi:MAG: DsrE family protein [Gammaproteobacteria bacterium]|nr:DsrE family protein [Gammaproteobacteria bacterium]